MELKEKNKKFGPKRIINAIKNSISGLTAAYTSEPSLMILCLLSICLIILGIIFKITVLEWVAVIICIATCSATELLNTAIEKVVDLVTKEFNPLAKNAKDMASAAEFIFVMMSVCILAIIYIPRIVEMF